MTIIACDNTMIAADRLSSNKLSDKSFIRNRYVTKIIPNNYAEMHFGPYRNKVLGIGCSGSESQMNLFLKKLDETVGLSRQAGEKINLRKTTNDLLGFQLGSIKFSMLIFTTHDNYKMTFRGEDLVPVTLRDEQNLLMIGSGIHVAYGFHSLDCGITPIEAVFLATLGNDKCGGGIDYLKRGETQIRHKRDLTTKQREKLAAKLHTAIMNGSLNSEQSTLG